MRILSNEEVMAVSGGKSSGAGSKSNARNWQGRGNGAAKRAQKPAKKAKKPKTPEADTDGCWAGLSVFLEGRLEVPALFASIQARTSCARRSAETGGEQRKPW